MTLLERNIVLYSFTRIPLSRDAIKSLLLHLSFNILFSQALLLRAYLYDFRTLPGDAEGISTAKSRF